MEDFMIIQKSSIGLRKINNHSKEIRFSKNGNQRNQIFSKVKIQEITSKGVLNKKLKM